MLCIQSHLNNVFDRLAGGTLTPVFVIGGATLDRDAEITALEKIFPDVLIVRESRAFIGTMRELDGKPTNSSDLYILVGTHGLATEAFIQSRLEGYKRSSVILIPDNTDTIVTDNTSRLQKFKNNHDSTGRILSITMVEVAALLSGTAQKGPKPNLPAGYGRTSDTPVASGDKLTPAP